MSLKTLHLMIVTHPYSLFYHWHDC